jgi:hypothetical protein
VPKDADRPAYRESTLVRRKSLRPGMLSHGLQDALGSLVAFFYEVNAGRRSSPARETIQHMQLHDILLRTSAHSRMDKRTEAQQA